MKIRNNRSNLYIYAIVCAFYFYIAYQIPYTGDDWDWGLDIGLQHLLTADINSRYAGNLMVVIMTRSKLLQTLIMGMSFFGIPFLMAGLVCKRSDRETKNLFAILFIAANILMLSMDKRIWQQTYGWISGFANYGISVVMVLIYLHLVDPLFGDPVEEKQISSAKCIEVFVLGVVVQLFLENLALAMLLLSAMVCLVSYLRTGKISRKYAGLLIGNILGLAIMFSSKIYPALFGDGSAVDGVRYLSFTPKSGIIEPIRRCIETVYEKELVVRTWGNNLVICTGISISLIALLVSKFDTSLGKREYALLVSNVLTILCFVTFYYLERSGIFLRDQAFLKIVEFFINIGFFILVAIQIVILYRKQKWIMWKLLLLWTCAPLVILPLSAINVDAGGRFYLTSNCFLILVLLYLMKDCLESIKANAVNGLLCLSLIVVLSFSMVYMRNYRVIDKCTQQRMEIIKQTKWSEVKRIELPVYPYPVNEYVWGGDPRDETRKIYFREFYGLDPDVEVILVQE